MSIPHTLAPVRVGSVGLKPTKKVPLKVKISPETVTGRFPFLLPGREWSTAAGWSKGYRKGGEFQISMENEITYAPMCVRCCSTEFVLYYLYPIKCFRSGAATSRDHTPMRSFARRSTINHRFPSIFRSV
ncbi:hypothetical protein EVAR_7354_1 [Eumeta japonica]|uniref:Uncharacterized protein n=1 Tax=Eumeta variegata TaxID=151549 RepID=A0A4C1T3N3_EUMVA|nr:hypothetical protein EVAR_7354_1 [Eumeta japonica]